MRHAMLALATAALVTGCATTKEIKRSALVPAITPPTMTGQPIDNGRAQLTFANATYLRSKAPVEYNQEANAGLYIPRTQFAAQALFRLGRDFSLGPKLEVGLNQGAFAIAENMPPKPDGATVAIGPAFQYSIPVSRHFRIGLGIETLLAFAPYNKFTRTVTTDWVEEDSGVDSTLILGMALMPSFRWGPVVAFAGVAGRNQPTSTKSEIRSVADLDDGDDVRFGPMYLVTFGGLQLRLFKRLELTTAIYYPVTSEPVDYGGPALSVSLGVAVGDPWQPRRRYPPPPPPPPHLLRPPGPTPLPAPAPTPTPAPAPAPAPAPEPPPDGDAPVDIQ